MQLTIRALASCLIFMSSFLQVRAELVYTIVKGTSIKLDAGNQGASCSNTAWKAMDSDGNNAITTLSCTTCTAPMATPNKTTTYTLSSLDSRPANVVITVIVSNIEDIAQLKEVFFYDKLGGGLSNFFPIRRDDNGEFYVNGNQPHWTFAGISHPIAYMSGTRMRVSAKLNIDGLKSPTLNIKIKGAIYVKGEKLAELPTLSKTITRSSNAIDYQKQFADAPFILNKIVYDAACKIKWQISFDNGSTWANFSESSNELYVVLKKPTDELPERYEWLHTLFHLSCIANEGTIVNVDRSILTTNLWKLFDKKFWGNSVTDLNGKLKKKSGISLKYYGTSDGGLSGSPLPRASSYQIIRNSIGDGQCGAFALLFIDLHRIQGENLSSATNSKGVYTKSNNGTGTTISTTCTQDIDRDRMYFMVKDWDFIGPTANGKLPITCNIMPHFIMTRNGPGTGVVYTLGGLSYHRTFMDAKDRKGVSGQNSENPNSLFYNHNIVKINNIYYDPSYGVIYNNANTMREALAGWMYKSDRSILESEYGSDIDGDPSTDRKFDIWYATKNIQAFELDFDN